MNLRDWKADPSEYVRTHFRSFVNADTGKLRPGDFVSFLGIPAAVGLFVGLYPVVLPVAASVGLLTVVGILSALLFGLMTQVGDRAAELVSSAPAPSERTNNRAKLSLEMAANSGYGSFISLVSAGLFVVCSVAHGILLQLFSALGLTLGAHLFLTLMMVMKRSFSLTMSNLNRAATGEAWSGQARSGNAG